MWRKTSSLCHISHDKLPRLLRPSSPEEKSDPFWLRIFDETKNRRIFSHQDFNRPIRQYLPSGESEQGSYFWFQLRHSLLALVFSLASSPFFSILLFCFVFHFPPFFFFTPCLSRFPSVVSARFFFFCYISSAASFFFACFSLCFSSFLQQVFSMTGLGHVCLVIIHDCNRLGSVSIRDSQLSNQPISQDTNQPTGQSAYGHQNYDIRICCFFGELQ